MDSYCRTKVSICQYFRFSQPRISGLLLPKGRSRQHPYPGHYALQAHRRQVTLDTPALQALPYPGQCAPQAPRTKVGLDTPAGAEALRERRGG